MLRLNLLAMKIFIVCTLNRLYYLIFYLISLFIAQLLIPNKSDTAM